MNFRIEKDTMGEMQVPSEALYGAQTARALLNFTVSGAGIGREMICALGLIKAAAAKVNRNLGLLEAGIADAIIQAAHEVADGQHDVHFPVDCFQTGSGTSSNMNANEVIANRAIQIMGGKLGSRNIHPNDHVNLGQSSNDVFPTAIHVAARSQIETELFPVLWDIHSALLAKEKEFDPIVKIGRTHLQDATPIRLGQEFSAFTSQVGHAIVHIQNACLHLNELAIGGTAVGTGINTHPDFGRLMAEELASITGLPFCEAPNHFEAQAAQDAAVQISGSLKTLAVGLMKMANDIRWLGSGPRLGLGELELPAVQPGSSIMPGKINPVMAESLIMVCAQVIANDTAITLGGLYTNFQLNTMLPLIARNLLEQIHLLARGGAVFTAKLLNGLVANTDHLNSQNNRSLSLATALAPVIGYDAAAAIAKEAHRHGKNVSDVVREKQILSEQEIKRFLDLKTQTEPGAGKK